MTNSTCDTDESDEFYLTQGAFRFANQLNGASVIFKIVAVVCLNDPGSWSECQSQCASCGGLPTTPGPVTRPPVPITPDPFTPDLFTPFTPDPASRRKRRDIVQESLATKYYVDVGPFKFADVEQEQQEQKGMYLCDDHSSSIFPGGDPHMKQTGMLFVSLSSVNFIGSLVLHRMFQGKNNNNNNIYLISKPIIYAF